MGRKSFGEGLVSKEDLIELGEIVSIIPIWNQKLEESDKQKSVEIDQALSCLESNKATAKDFIACIWTNSMSGSPTLDMIEIFRMNLPQINIADDVNESELLMEYKKQKKIHDALVKTTFSLGVTKSLRMELLKLIVSHFPFGMQWSLKGKKKGKRGRNKQWLRNVCLVCLILLFQDNGMTLNDAYQKVHAILKIIEEDLSQDGLESAYKNGRKILQTTSLPSP